MNEYHAKLTDAGIDMDAIVPSEQEESQPQFPEGVLLGDLETPQPGDDSELLKNRFLSRGDSCIVTAPTGEGKSALIMQQCIKWSVGKPAFGVEPTRPLSSWIIQSENNLGDMAEMRNGILTGCQRLGELTAEEAAEAEKGIKTFSIDYLFGEAFCRALDLALRKAKEKPDLIIIDPAYGFFGGDAMNQAAVSAFLRMWLGPVLKMHGVGVIITHHTNKSNWNAGAYLASGSAEWINWARTAFSLLPAKKDGVFCLHATKHGARLGWKNSAGETVKKRYIAHSPDGLIYWRDVDASEAVEASSGSAVKPAKSPSASDVAETAVSLLQAAEGNVMPKGELETVLKSKLGIGRDKAKKGVATALKSGRLFEGKVKRSKVIGLDKAAVDAAVVDGDWPQGGTQSAPATASLAQASLEIQP